MPNYSFQHTIKPRKGTNDALLIDVLDGLLERYIERVPDAQKIINLMVQSKNTIINDHIAFRSIDIRSILKVFMHLGYDVKMDAQTGMPFNFKEKKLTAVWLKHPHPCAPRVFVSQFRFDEGSDRLKETISSYLDDWDDPIDQINLNSADEINTYLHTAQWKTPTYKDYKTIKSESEYLSWVLYNKYYLNHFTLTVQDLKSFKFEPEICQLLKDYRASYQSQGNPDSILNDCIRMLHRRYVIHMTVFNSYLIEHGFDLNAKEKDYLNVSPDGCLLQSSTKSNPILAEFPDGEYNIPGSYVEFAYRGLLDSQIRSILEANDYIDNLKPYAIRDGFETANADKIFESTYTRVDQIVNHDVTNQAYEKSCYEIDAFLKEMNPI